MTRLPVFLLLAIATTMPTRAVTEIKGVDASGHEIILNRQGYVTVVIASNEDIQDETRAAGKVLDPYRGRSDFRLIVVADLRDSLAGLVPDYVRKRMREDLDREALRLTPFYRKNGNQGNPRGDLFAIADFDGKISTALGAPEATESMWVVILGRNGERIQRWNRLTDYSELRKEVETALGPAPKHVESPVKPGIIPKS